MAQKFDTHHNDRSQLAPPRGQCRVCTEGPSDFSTQPDARSYALIGAWSAVERKQAIEHAREAQDILNEEAHDKRTSAPAVVVFDHLGKVAFRGRPYIFHAPVAPPAPPSSAPANIPPAAASLWAP